MQNDEIWSEVFSVLCINDTSQKFLTFNAVCSYFSLLLTIWNALQIIIRFFWIWHFTYSEELLFMSMFIFFNVIWNTKRKNLHSVGIFCNFFPKNNISSIVLNVFIVNYNQISCSLHNEWIMDIITEYLNFFYIATNKSYERMKQIILVRGSRYRFSWIKKQFFNVLSQERKDVNPTALFALNSNMLLGFTISKFFR